MSFLITAQTVYGVVSDDENESTRWVNIVQRWQNAPVFVAWQWKPDKTTVEPCFTDTRLLRQSRRKTYIFSLILARLIPTPVNTDNAHFSETRVTCSHTKLLTLVYLRKFSRHFHFSRLFCNCTQLEKKPYQLACFSLSRTIYKWLLCRCWNWQENINFSARHLNIYMSRMPN